MEIEIREFKPEDTNAILKIHNEQGEYFEDFPVTREFILEISKRDDFRFFVAEFSSEIIGFAGILFHSVVGRAEIGPIAVSSEFKNKKVGKKLIENITKFLEDMEVRRVIVKVKIDNKNAIKFFIKLGFTQEGYFKKYTKKREDVLQLVKFL